MEDSSTQTAPPPELPHHAPPMMSDVARIAHATNRAYCECIGDFSQPSWEDAPDWQRKSAMAGVAYHMVELHDGRQPSAGQSHDRWLERKRAEGWKFGPVKNPEKKEHPCFLPYDELPFAQKLKDHLFSAIVRAFFEAGRDYGTPGSAVPDSPKPPR